MRKVIILLAFMLASFTSAHAQEAFIGEIRLFAGNFAPRGWEFCHGQSMQISQYSALYSIIGRTYGGDGRINFALPDHRSKTAQGTGNSPEGVSTTLGQRFKRSAKNSEGSLENA